MCNVLNGCYADYPEVMTESKMRRMLGFEICYELDGFLEARGVLLAYTVKDEKID